MNAAYQVFASALLSVCPEGFSSAELLAEVDTGWSEVMFNCEINGEKVLGLQSSTQIGSDVDDALHDLRDAMTLPGQEPWSKCTFTLFPDGQFTFDVEYDD